MKKSTCFIFLVICLACTPGPKNECRIDEVFRENFQNSVNIASTRANYQSTGKDLDASAIFRAYSSLKALTGVQSQEISEDGVEGTYVSHDAFIQDSIAWVKWFEDQKCNMTMDSAEKIFASKREPFPNYNDPQVMERIKELWPIHYADSARRVDSLQHIKFSINWPSTILKENIR
jgi:hypothetical protein